MTVAASLITEFGADVDPLKKGFNEAESLQSRFTSGIQAMGKAAIAVGATMGAAIVGGAAAMATKGVQAAAALEAQMDGVQAVLGGTAAEMAALNKLTLDLAINPNLKVDAVQAADAIEMLARNGLTASEIMEGAAEATVLLANATGAEFGTAANIATDAMALWNIEASNMMDAVDGITSVVNASKFDINDYALALAQGGGVAASVGVEFEDFNSTIAAISPLFASGSDAGTAFKTMLQRLVPSTNPATEAMRELGLITYDTEAALELLAAHGITPASSSTQDLVESLQDLGEEFGVVGANAKEGAFEEWLTQTDILRNQFFETNGQLKSMADIQGILADATAHLTEEQKNQAFATIFGTDAMRAAFGMTNMTNEEFRALQETMSETSAVEGAAIRMDNLAGAMEIMDGIIESLSLQIGQALLPAVRVMVEAFTAFAGGTLQGVVEQFGHLIETMSMAKDPIGAVAIAISGIMQAFGASGQQVNEVVTRFREFVDTVVANKDAIIGALTGIAGAFAFAGVVTALGAAIAALTSPIGLIIAASAALGAAWATDWMGMQTVVTDAIAYITPALQQLAAAFSEGGLQGAITTLVGIVQTELSKIITFITGQLSPQWIAAFDAIMQVLTPIGEALRTSLGQVLESVTPLVESFGTAWQALQPILQGIVIGLGALTVGLVNAIAQGIGPFVSGVMTMTAGVLQALSGLVSIFTETFRSIVAVVTGNNEAVEASMQRMREAVLNIVEGLLTAILAAFGTVLSTVAATVGGFIEGVINFFRTLSSTLVGNSIVPDMINAILQWFAKLPAEGIQLIAEFVTGLISELTTAIGRASAAASDIGQAIIDGIRGAISAGAGSIASAISGLITGALDAAKRAAGIESPSTVFADEVGNPIAEGIAAGILAGTGEVTDAIKELIEEVLGHAEHVLSSASTLGSLGNVFARMFTTQSIDPVTRYIEELDEALAAVEDRLSAKDDELSDLFKSMGGSSLADLQEELAHLDALGARGALTMDDYRRREELRKAIAEAEEIEKEKLRIEQEQLKLEEARAKQVQHRLELEEKILALQEQQANLDFLKAQFDLAQFFMEQGLDPSALSSIPGFGTVGADAGALMAAMTAALEQILAGVVIPITTPGLPDNQIPEFATGGTFQVGGSGGTDSQLVMFKATPGEVVDVYPPNYRHVNGAGQTVINNNMTVNTVQTVPSITHAWAVFSAQSAT